MRIAEQNFCGFQFHIWNMDRENSEVKSTVKMSTYMVRTLHTVLWVIKIGQCIMLLEKWQVGLSTLEMYNTYMQT